MWGAEGPSEGLEAGGGLGSVAGEEGGGGGGGEVGRCSHC